MNSTPWSPEVRLRAAPSLAWVPLAMAAALGSGCKNSGGQAQIGGLGVPVARGNVSDLRVTPDGKFAAFLVDAEKPHLEGAPPYMVLGELNVVPTTGGVSRKVGNGVTNAPGGLLFSQNSRWVLFLEGYSPAVQAGELIALDLTDAAAEPKRLGTGVTYMLPSPDSKSVAFVAEGTLKLADLGSGQVREVAGEVSTCEFSPDSKLLFFKRRQSAAGGLWLWRTEKLLPPQKLSDQVGEMVVSPDSSRVAFQVKSPAVPNTFDLHLAAAPDFRPVKVASGSSAFAFSADGRHLVRTEAVSLQAGVQSLNFLGALHVGPSDGGPGKKVADRVREFTLSPDSKSVAFLHSYNLELSQGKFAVADLATGAVKELGRKVKSFTWAPDGRHVAYQEIVPSKELGPSPDIMLYRIGAQGPVKIESWGWGYAFGKNGDYLVARAPCAPIGGKGVPRACPLVMRDLTAEKPATKKIIEGVYSFKSSDDGQRLLVMHDELGAETYQVAVYNVKTGERRTLDGRAVLPAHFLEKDGSRVAYIIADRKRAGVYVCDKVP